MRYLIGSRQSRDMQGNKILGSLGIVKFFIIPYPFESHVNFHTMHMKKPEDVRCNQIISSKQNCFKCILYQKTKIERNW